MSQTVPDSSRDVGFCRFHPLWGLSFQHVCQCRIALSNLSHVDKQGTRQELTSGEKKLILQTDQNTPHWILKPAAQAVASIGMALAMVSSSSYNGASRNLEISAKVTEDPNASWASSSSCSIPTRTAISVSNGTARQQGTKHNDNYHNANISNIASIASITTPLRSKPPMIALHVKACRRVLCPAKANALARSARSSTGERDGSDGQNWPNKMSH